MKKHVLIWAAFLALSITMTTLYAQTTIGSSIIDKMKEATRAFTLTNELNPGQTGLQSTPVSGKKTGDILTAAEWNRMLELVGSGDTWPGWVDVPLSDTSDFDTSCEYRYNASYDPDNINSKWMNSTTAKVYIEAISNKYLRRDLDTSAQKMWGIQSTDKSKYWNRDATGSFTVASNITITKLEKLCGSRGGSSSAVTAPVVKTKHKPATTTSLTFDIPTWSRYATAKVFGNAGGDASSTNELNNENYSMMDIVFDFQNNKSSWIHTINLGSSRNRSLEYSWEDQAFGVRVTKKEWVDAMTSHPGWSTGVRPIINVSTDNKQLIISGLSSKELTEIWMVTFY